MRLVSFDAFRSLRLPDTTYIKPELFFSQLPTVQEADWVVYPEYWQVNSLVFGLKKRIFPSLSSYLLGHDKIEMTRAFMSVAPRHVPDTEIMGNTPENAELVWDRMLLPFVAKIPRSSMGQGVFLIENRAQWNQYLSQTTVLYVQELLPIDRDMRIVWIGKKVLGGYWRLQSDRSFHNNVAQGGQLDYSPLHPAAVRLVEEVATRLGIDHGGFDVCMVGDHPYLFEFNRLFGNQGLGPLNQQLPEAIMQYLESLDDQDDPDDPLHPNPILPLAM
ncbi:RimK family alpha-L-glutamate ligase [Pokkaliibacter sp. CJK22405]|uniref:ATP-grasp domain-containing protein n=1 Tax=Pokkaliibacter sp. CJK22405 TaxID=3384615 RepID=UPI0039851DA2